MSRRSPIVLSLPKGALTAFNEALESVPVPPWSPTSHDDFASEVSRLALIGWGVERTTARRLSQHFPGTSAATRFCTIIATHRGLPL